MNNQIVNTIKKVLCSYTELEMNEIDHDMRMADDLYLDSYDMDAVLYELEDYLECDLSGVGSEIISVSDLIATVKASM